MFARLLPSTLPITRSCFLYLNIANKDVNISGEDEARAKYIEPTKLGEKPKFCNFKPRLARRLEPTPRRRPPAMILRVILVFVDRSFFRKLSVFLFEISIYKIIPRTIPIERIFLRTISCKIFNP